MVGTAPENVLGKCIGSDNILRPQDFVCVVCVYILLYRLFHSNISLTRRFQYISKPFRNVRITFCVDNLKQNEAQSACF